MFLGMTLGVFCGLLLGYRLALRISRQISQRSSSPRVVSRGGHVGALASVMPSLYLAYIAGGNLGGSVGAFASDNLGLGDLGIPLGVGVGIALFLGLGLLAGAVLGSVLGIGLSKLVHA